MFPNRIAIAALIVACVAAATGGGYLATRHNVASIAASDAAAASVPERNPSQPVQETEALVSAALQPESAPSASLPGTAVSAPAKRPAPASGPVPTNHRMGAEKGAARTAEKPPALERSWPSGNSSTSSSSTPATVSADAQEPATHIEERPSDTPRAPEPPAKSFQELVVAADSVVGLQTESALSSEMSRVEDPIEARVVRDVHVGGEVAIPAGTRAIGSVISVERGGKFKERARLGIRFQTLVLADGTRLPMTTDTIYRYGDAPGNGTAARIGGGAVVGAIIGGIIGGGKGAAIGATTGAGAGTASVMTSDRSAAVFPKGTEVTARILSPVTVTIEK
jgi:hypothetical protein